MAKARGDTRTLDLPDREPAPILKAFAPKLGKFVALNSWIADARICTSPDGVTWIVAVSLGPSFQTNVAVGNYGLLAFTDYGAPMRWPRWCGLEGFCYKYQRCSNSGPTIDLG